MLRHSAQIAPFLLARRGAALASLVVWLAAVLIGAHSTIGADRLWEHSPYRIRMLLAVDAPGSLRGHLEQYLPTYIQDRVDAAVGPVWSLNLELAQADVRSALLEDFAAVALPQVAGEDAAMLVHSADKLMLVVVRHADVGFQLLAREYDTYVDHWGQVVRDDCFQQLTLPERVFQLACRTFAPIARLELDPEDEDRVVLELQGTQVPAKDTSASWISPGEVFQPYLRRTTRDGELVENGLQAVPWTYVAAEETDGSRIAARVYSGTRRPFGVRRRGRIEQLAIALRGEPAPITVHVRSQSDSAKPLTGYEVFVQDAGETSLQLVGTTDYDGTVTVPSAATRVRLLYLKNGGQLLARVPVVPGTQQNVELVLPDDEARLQAEAALTAVRENLIDVVAQRNIFIARTRREIDAGDLQRAEVLLEQLDDLPGRAQFNRQLEQLASQHTSADPQIQRRIDKLLSDTRSILGHFLDVREINRLRDEVNAAKSAGG